MAAFRLCSSESHAWLRAIAESKLRDPVIFWKKMDANPTAKGEIPESAIEAIEHMLPQHGMRYRLARRRAGLGSLGRTRLVGVAEWNGGRVAREAKALLPTALQCVDPKRVPSEILYGAILRRSVRCPDPYVQMRGHWIVRRLSPHCSRIELDALPITAEECRLLEAMGRETANIHVGYRREARFHPERPAWTKRELAGGRRAAMADAMEKDWRVWKERWQS
jgi:hypothetical protein